MSRRSIMLGATGFFGVLAIVVGAYLVTGSTDDLVAKGVAVGTVDLSGMTGTEAEQALLNYEDELLGKPVQILVGDNETLVDPTTLGAALDTSSLAQAALHADDDEGFVQGFLTWVGLRSREVVVPATIELDAPALDAAFTGWDLTLLGEDSVGGIRLEGITPIAQYAAPAARIQRPAAADLIAAAISAATVGPIELPTEVGPPLVSDADVDAALVQTRQLLSGSVTLDDAVTSSSITLTPEDLAGALVIETATGDTSGIMVGLDPDVMDTLFEPIRDQFADTFQNATFSVSDDDVVTIVPGVSGPKVSTDIAIAEIFSASASPGRTGLLPLENSAEPDITAADLDELGVEHLVSKFTTYHDCCGNRVENIHLMADTIDGAIVLPGEEFSLNGFVGERTTAKGYLPAGTIINGEIVDTVGGGVSQFATTFYNAVFWGGYTDVTHKPHSFYFSRYPEGIEATINWPNLDLAFRNDTDQAILINAVYTDSSLTVKFFSDNNGQAVGGEQRGGETITWVESEGTGVVVTGSVSGRFNFTSPSTQYVTDASLEPGESQTKQDGGDGWSVTVTRTRTYPDGTVEIDEWLARYVAKPRILVVHPCSVPGTSTECPESTTTTDGSATTTTTVGGSTTTTLPATTTTTPAATTTTVAVTTTTVAPTTTTTAP